MTKLRSDEPPDKAALRLAELLEARNIPTLPAEESALTEESSATDTDTTSDEPSNPDQDCNERTP